MSLQVGKAQGESKKIWVNQLATHLPDVVVFVDHTRITPFQCRSQGVLMFLDISGFTALCEQYAMSSKNGTDQLTKTLNGYMEALVSEILNSDGDILKFAGDAILTLWKVESFKQIKATVQQVILCAMGIQHKYGIWTTSVGVKLSVKIGIAAGECSVTFLGHPEYHHYLTLGRAVKSVNLAEKFCKSGDIVVSPTAWCHCGGLRLEHQVLDDGKHVKIIGTANVAEKLGYQYINMVPRTSAMGVLIDCQQKSTTSAVVDLKAASKTHLGSMSMVRKAVITELDDFSEEKKKLYIAKPVLRKIEDHQPLEYLSEMRQVTIVFINLIIQDCTNMELALVLQQAFDIIYINAKQSQGSLNKIFAFDKGSTFLVIFGLPGFKHENDCAHALRCSHQIHEELSKIKPILGSSIGVTTGSTFCGVVGHNHRHEYTVIGRKVNMAARLMMYYPNKITCDNETYHHSKLTKAHFYSVETKEMKGLSNVGIIREYLPSADADTSDVVIQQDFQYPIVGRDMELNLFKKEVEQIRKHQGEQGQRQVIAFNGESGIGRTKMLDALINLALKDNIRVISCSLTVHDTKIPFYAMKSLLNDLLNFSFEMLHQERENIFLEMFKADKYIIDHADLLNDILKVQFQSNENYPSGRRQFILYEVISQIIKECNKKFGLIIFTIDDAHFMDPDSWQFVHVLGRDKHSLVVMTLRMPFQMSATAEDLLNHNTYNVNLRGLDAQYLAPLACQMLDVSKISERLNSILKDKSHGVPSWMEQLLREMMRSGVIQVAQKKTVPLSEAMVSPNIQYLTKSRIVNNQEEFLEPENSNAVCVVIPNKTFDSGLPDSIKGMIQTRIDRMEELDQMIIKSASVLGMSFYRNMLVDLLPRKIGIERISIAIQRLADSGIFVCVFPNNKSLSSSYSNIKIEGISQTKVCFCPLIDGRQVEKPMTDCQLIRFVAMSMQETAYEMYLENMRCQLHIKAAKFLENQPHTCYACGGGNHLQTLLLKQDEMEKRSAEQRRLSSLVSEQQSTVMLFGYNPGMPDQSAMPFEGNVLLNREESRKRNNRRSSVARNIRKRLNHDNSSFRSISVHVGVALHGDSDIANKSKVVPQQDATNQATQEEDLDLVDLRECMCVTILMFFYPQLVWHWRAAGDVAKTVHYMLEASASAISTHDNMKALSFLQEATRIIDTVGRGGNPFDGEVTVADNYKFSLWELARKESLMGQALFHMGQMEESMTYFRKALNILKCPQPVTKTQIWRSVMKNSFKQWKHNHFPERYIGKANPKAYISMNEAARCFSHMLHWYNVNRMDHHVLNTILQQLNMAEAANNDLHEVILAYTCMMECCHVFRWHQIGELYEYKAQSRCLAAIQNVTSEDLVTMANFFVQSLNMRLNWGHLSKAIDSGYTALRLSQKIHDNELKLQLLPALTQALIMSNRIIDAVDMLKELQHTQEQTDDKMAAAIYYSSCLDLILETGFQLESYAQCLKYDAIIWKLNSPSANPTTQFYIQANVALWHVRKREWRKAHQWYRLVERVIWSSSDSFLSIRGLVRVLEYQIIKLAYTIVTNPKRSPAVSELEILVKKNLQWLAFICKTLPVFEPRYWHLNAYFCAVHGQNSLAKKHLSKCISVAKRLEYELEVEWAEHSGQVWYNPTNELIQADFWLEHADEGMLDWHMANSVEGSRIKYSLPLPHWFKTL